MGLERFAEPSEEESEKTIIWTMGRLGDLEAQGVIEDFPSRLSEAGQAYYLDLLSDGYIPIREAVECYLNVLECPADMLSEILDLVIG